ncbi:hypothetical protein WA158_001756 [Blastocystis sp. Blastoise]
MVQSWNSSGISAFFKVFTTLKSKQNLLPHMSYKTIVEIPFEKLKENGIELVVFDKDNTLTAPYKNEYFTDEVKKTVEKCQSLFGYSNVIMLSNSLGAEGEIKVDKKVDSNLNIYIFIHKHKKPEGFKELSEIYNIPYRNMIVVGDRYLTDIYGGNEYGMMTCHVDPFTEEGDNTMAKHARRLENQLVEKYKKQNIQAPSHPLFSKLD